MGDKVDKIKLMNDARLNKALERVYRFSDGVMSMGGYLSKHNPVRKSTTITNHTSKRVCLEYAKMKDKYRYTLWDENDNGIDVPKLVYGIYIIPEKINDNRF